MASLQDGFLNVLASKLISNLGRPTGKPRAATLFFHGGGWVRGSQAPTNFSHLWEPLLAREIACANAEYRVKESHSAPYSIYESLEDADAAAELLQSEFPDIPLFLAGASSGGALAILAARMRSVRGLILFNPVLDLSAGGFKSIATPKGGDESISPLHFSPATLPPMVILQGETDTITPLATARQFAEKTGAQLIILENTWHGFVKDPRHTDKIGRAMLGFIDSRLAQGPPV